MSDNVRILDNIKEIRALSDPYRQEILFAMTALDRPATSKEIATKMKEPPSKVNYHLKVLEKYNFVELDHTKNINGIIAKYYVSTVNNIDVKMKPGEEDKERAFYYMIETIFNSARDKYLKRASEMSSLEDDEKNKEKGMVSTLMVYLSEEEKNEVKALVNRFSNNEKEGREPYNLFISMIKSED